MNTMSPASAADPSGSDTDASTSVFAPDALDAFYSMLSFCPTIAVGESECATPLGARPTPVGKRCKGGSRISNGRGDFRHVAPFGSAGVTI